MANEPHSAAARSGELTSNVRWPWLDGLRGLAIIAMAIYHFTWDLTFFNFLPANVLRTTAFTLFGHSIACSFLGIAGFALAIASRPELDLRKFAVRLAKLAAAAALVTLATWFAFPQTFVSFGILHCIAAASIISLLFVRAPFWLTLCVGIAIFAAGAAVEAPRFDDVNGWIGLGERIPLTNDWRPIFPWAGAMLIGLGFGQSTLDRRWFARAVSPPPAWLAFGGRHSLLIYLVHQPLLFALVWIAAQILPARTASNISPEPFVKACAARCVETGSAADFCTRACACIARDAQAAGIWNDVASSSLKATGQQKYDAIIAACQRPIAR